MGMALTYFVKIFYLYKEKDFHKKLKVKIMALFLLKRRL